MNDRYADHFFWKLLLAALFGAALAGAAALSAQADDRLVIEIPVSAEVNELAGYSGLAAFTSRSCGAPCALEKQVWRALTEDGIALRVFEASQRPELFTRFGITAYPTTIALVGGVEVARAVGAVPEAALRARLVEPFATLPNWQEQLP